MENNLDKLFKSKLGGQEPEFHPAAWERMEGLLDESGMIPTQEEKPNRSKRYLLLFLLIGLLFSTVGYYSLQSNKWSEKGSTLVESTIPETKSILENSINTNSTYNKKVTKNTSENNLAKSKSENKVPSNTLSESSSQFKANVPENSILTENDVFNDRSKINTSTPSTKEHGVNPPVVSHQMEAEAIEHKLDKSVQKDIARSKTSTLKNTIPKKGLVENQKKEEAFTEGNYAKSSEDQNLDVLKEFIAPVDWLKTTTSAIHFNNKLITPLVEIVKPTLFELGIQASFRPGSASGYSVGPYLAYGVGKGYSIQIGGQFDSQSFENGPILSVFDKIYSFGSELRARNFVLSNQKSVRIPITVQKRFSNFSLSSGVIISHVIQSNGTLDPQDGGSEVISADHELIRTLTMGYHFGASVSLNRFLELDFAAEYRPRTLLNNVATSNNGNTLYPSLGLRYKLFKF